MLVLQITQQEDRKFVAPSQYYPAESGQILHDNVARVEAM